jgi:hypothetical protein
MKRSLKKLFAGLVAYVCMYGLLCVITLIYSPSPLLRLSLVLLFTAAVLGRVFKAMLAHADEIQAWGVKHIN